MADPFKETIDQVVDYAEDELPSLNHLKKLQTYLSHEEHKTYALDRDLAQSLFKHYGKTMDQSDFEECRVVIVQMLTHLITLKKCRDLLFHSIGMTQALLFLKDSAVAVRTAAATLFFTMTTFPDAQDFILADREVVDALTGALLKDARSVGLAAVPALAVLTKFDPQMEAVTINKLVVLLTEHTPKLENGVQAEVLLCRNTLQCIWNVCCAARGQELAIECKVVEAVSPLVAATDNDIRRLSVGVLSAISVAERGKVAIIETEGVVESLCQVALDLKAESGLRTNAILAIRNIAEAPAGLHACGAHLITESDILNEILTPKQCSDVICAILEKEEASKDAMQAMSLLVKTPTGRRATWEILDVVPLLHGMSSSKSIDARVRGMARRCLEALCLDNPLAQLELDKLSPLLAEDLEDLGDIETEDLVVPETALLLLQYQNDFTMKAGIMQKVVFESLEETQMVWNTVDLVEKARRKGCAVYHLILSIDPDTASSMADYDQGHLKDIIDAGAFLKDTWGSEITQELAPERDDIVLKMNGLSGFSGTDLEKELRDKGLKTLVVAGLMSDGSVDKTIRDAYERGFKVYTMTDCTAASSSAALEATVSQVFPTFSQPLTHTQLLSFLK